MKRYCACLFLCYSTNMAAPRLTAVRATLTGFSTCRFLFTHRFQTPTVCRHSRLHVQSSAGLWSSRTEPQQSDRTGGSAGVRAEEQEEIEYIPRRKARNPMMKIGYAWMIGLPTGIVGFLLAKRQVDKNRLKQMKIRQRMKQSNEGEYEGSRYLQQERRSKLDQ
nr:DUF4748 domain-containing protein [Nothobranchius furzeri]